MSTIGSLVVNVSADSSGFGKAIKQGMAQTKEFAAGVGKLNFGNTVRGANQANKAIADMNANVHDLDLAGWHGKIGQALGFDMNAEKNRENLIYLTQGEKAWREYTAAVSAAANASADFQAMAGRAGGGIAKVTDQLKAVQAMIDAQVADVRNLGRSPEQLAADRVREAGGTDQQAAIAAGLERTKARFAAVEAEARQKELDAAAKLNDEFEQTRQLLEGLMTPADRLGAELERIQHLFDQGNFDVDTFNALNAKARQDMLPPEVQEAKKATGSRLPAALIRGSAAEVSARNNLNVANDPAKQQVDLQKKTVQELMEMNRRQAQLIGAVKEGAAAAVVVDF